jgi:hypothetical protein
VVQRIKELGDVETKDRSRLHGAGGVEHLTGEIVVTLPEFSVGDRGEDSETTRFGNPETPPPDISRFSMPSRGRPIRQASWTRRQRAVSSFAASRLPLPATISARKIAPLGGYFEFPHFQSRISGRSMPCLSM